MHKELKMAIEERDVKPLMCIFERISIYADREGFFDNQDELDIFLHIKEHVDKLPNSCSISGGSLKIR